MATNVASNGHKKQQKTQKLNKVLKHSKKRVTKNMFFTLLFPVYHFPEGKFSVNETKTAISNSSGSDHAAQNNVNCRPIR